MKHKKHHMSKKEAHLNYLKHKRENKKMEKRKILIASIIVVFSLVVILSVVILIKEDPFGGEVPVNFENYESISNAEIDFDTVTFSNNGQVTMNLEQGNYMLYYELEGCESPSEKFDYSRTNSEGETMSYDPLKEELTIDDNGEFQLRELSESEQLDALVNEEVYVLRINEDEHVVPMVFSGVYEFEAEGSTEFKFRSKCDGATVEVTSSHITD